MADVQLLVNGAVFAGWTEARITIGIESVAGGFSLSVSDRWKAGQAPWAIYEEDACSIRIGGEVLITGYVDQREISYDAGQHQLSVSGRDRAGSLVDCSAVLDAWEFLSTPILALVARIAAPFGLTVSAATALPAPMPKVSIDPGDSAFDAIEKVCRKAGVLPISNGRGGLVLMRPGARRATTALVEGENILSASARFDATGRFYRYLLLGESPGGEKWDGSPRTSVRAEAKDLGVKRTERVLVVRPEGQVEGDYARRRAQWEATVRAARADSITISVQGWTQGDGSLWPVNALVDVQAPRLGVSGELLITEASFTLGERGSTTQLTLRRPDAFKPEPVVQQALWKEIARGV